MELSLRSVMLLSLSLFLVTLFSIEVDAKRLKFQPGPWKHAHATYYGNPDGKGTMEGTCGYGDLKQYVFGKNTVALSTVMFNNGAACGACFEVRCNDSPQWCKSSSVVVTATNLCPDGGWCAPPREHFDLSQPAFRQIADQRAGIVPIQYRRVPCIREGGIKYTISPNSNPYFMLVLVWNVASVGDVESVTIKGSDGVKWTPMKRNWGQYWETRANLVGQSITFRVRASDGRTTTAWHVAPKNWQFGQTYQGKNFK